MSAERRIRICVATSYGATEEPRGPRYAAELAKFDPAFEVVFVDCVPRGRESLLPVEFEGIPNIRLHSWHFPWRGGGRAALTVEKVQHRLACRTFRQGGPAQTAALSTRVIGMERILIAQKADLYLGFNIDTLLPVHNAARAAGVPFMFDCHEIHAEMAHHQSATEKAVVRAVQRQCLPLAALVMAASPEAAAFIEVESGISGVLPLLNAAPIEELPNTTPAGEFTLYWRNSTLDLGQRGLNDILAAMALLPPGIPLYLQGRPPHDGTWRVDNTIRSREISDRVVILPPYRRRDAVKAAVPYTIGLSLESPDCVNMDLTSTNKFFEYAMAGLAIIATRTRGMEKLVEANGLGLFYEAGNAQSLATQIMRLYRDRELLANMRIKARQYAVGAGSLEFQLRSLREAFRERVLPLVKARFAERRMG